nr:FIST C-terminal domain-containing protein [Bacteroidales bacterium]
NMKIELDSTGTIDNFVKIIEKFDKSNNINGILILSCDANNFRKEDLDIILTNISKPILGGIFPSIIHGNKRLDRGTIFVGLDSKPNINIIQNISDNDTNFENLIKLNGKNNSKVNTMFVFVDGFANRISAFIDSLFINYGLKYNYIGGGVGSLSLTQKPCIYTNKGLLEDCAIIGGISSESGIGVTHGWKEGSGPYKVTKADKNVIKEIDWKPAFEIYKAFVNKHSGEIINKENFFEIAKAYPFGISKMGSEKIVRDAIAVNENNSIVCIGEVPEESYIFILTGNVNSLVSAADIALKMSKKYLPSNKKHKYSFFIDCISRALFLDKDFQKELDIVNQEDIPLFGALTLGEIANSKKDYLEFYNKTSVMGVFEKL